MKVITKVAKIFGLKGSSPIVQPTLLEQDTNPEMLSAEMLAKQRTELSTMRSHMANERTHLAQVRTGISLISFGITLNRFSLYLVEKNKSPNPMPELSNSATFGIGMVVLGTILLAWSLYRYHVVYRQITTMTFTVPRLSLNIMTITIILLGAASAAWMILL